MIIKTLLQNSRFWKWASPVVLLFIGARSFLYAVKIESTHASDLGVFAASFLSATSLIGLVIWWEIYFGGSDRDEDFP